MEEAYNMLESKGIESDYLEVPENYDDSNCSEFFMKIRGFIEV
jgi:hypothetical protein